MPEMVHSYHASRNKYLYDQWNVISERIYDSSFILQHSSFYTWGLDLSNTLQGAGGVGGLLAASTPDGEWFYCYDGNGNITTLVSTTDGTITAQYDYSPFGLTVAQTGPAADANTYRFSTKPLDETGLYYYGFRYYNPMLGRWMSRDPLFEGFETGQVRPHSVIGHLTVFNRVDDIIVFMRYVSNRPIDRIDFIGLASLCSSWHFQSNFNIPELNIWLVKVQGSGQLEFTAQSCRKCCPNGGTGYDKFTAWTAQGVFTATVNFPLAVSGIPLVLSVGGGGTISGTIKSHTDTCTGSTTKWGCHFWQVTVGGDVCSPGNVLCAGISFTYQKETCVDHTTTCIQGDIHVKLCTPGGFFCTQWNLIEINSCGGPIY